MRLRLSRLIHAQVPKHLLDVRSGEEIEAKLGIEIVSTAAYSPAWVNWEKLVRKQMSIHDLLSVVTLLGTSLDTPAYRKNFRLFRDGVQRIFAEERVGYSVDEKLGIHPALDAEFERSISSIIGVLTKTEYSTEAEFIRQSEMALLADPLDGRAAINAVYQAAENLFKRLTKKQNITVRSVRADLRPIAVFSDSRDDKGNRAVDKMLTSFEEWVAACHNYRHAPGSNATLQPTEALALLMVSQGYAYVRWLADLHDQHSRE